MSAAPHLWAIEKRDQRRASVRLVATMMTECGDHTVRLRDLSRTGAGLVVDELPAVGSIVVLAWRNLEVVSTVIWAEEGRCGLEFHEPIALEYILLARHLSENYVADVSSTIP